MACWAGVLGWATAAATLAVAVLAGTVGERTASMAAADAIGVTDFLLVLAISNMLVVAAASFITTVSLLSDSNSEERFCIRESVSFHT